MARAMRLINGRFWTADEKRPRAWSVLVRDGRIEAVDAEDGGGTAETVDLEGRVALPGLIDAHLHLVMGGLALAELDLSGVRTREAFERAIAERNAELPAGEWLIGTGWSSENWGGEEPTKEWLRAAGSRPVVCWRMDRHACLVNEAVLEKCDTSGEIEGGRVARSRGRPTGLMVEAAAWRLVIPLVPEPDANARRAALRAAARHLNAFGVTTVGAMEYARTVREVLLPERESMPLRVRITLLDRDRPLDLAFARAFEPDGRLAIVGFKAFLDGTLGSRTARLLADYADDPGNRGLWLEHAAEGTLLDWAREVAAAGFQPAMHAIGDEAVRRALDAMDAVDALDSVDGRGPAADVRPRIEHAQQIAAEDIPRFAGDRARGRGGAGARGRIASMQPTHKADDGRYARRRLGEARMAGFFPFRQLREAGAVLAFGSDWPIVSCDPFQGIRAAVTGRTFDGDVVRAEENLAVEEALLACTRDAAWALRSERDLGTITPGKAADLTVVDRDPFACDWANETPRAERVMVGGEWVVGG